MPSSPLSSSASAVTTSPSCTDLALGKNEDGWRQVFTQQFALEGDTAARTRAALAAFKPDAVYVHKMADLKVIQALVDSDVPLVRMVHDHDIYCMRSYKYDYFTRKICTRAASSTAPSAAVPAW
jgi:hypothetical protein